MNQIILPANQQYTILDVSTEHIRLQQSGQQILIAFLRERYLILRLTILVKTLNYLCLKCYRFKAPSTQQLMGELPSKRVQTSRTYFNTGVDYAGLLSLNLDHNVAKP